MLIVERWILARLRNRRFFSLDELNTAISLLLLELNARAFKKLPGSRNSAFELLDRPVLGPLPATRMPIVRFKAARVNIDYHVELDGHFYSVPYQLRSKSVDMRITSTTLEVLSANKRVAVHLVSGKQGAHSTIAEHMPASHRAHRDWTPQGLIRWGERIGAATAAVVRWQMEHRPHPEQGYRACLGLRRLAKHYGNDRLEAACARAITINSRNYRSINAILKAALDRQPVAATDTKPMPLHDNVRGPDYYH